MTPGRSEEVELLAQPSHHIQPCDETCHNGGSPQVRVSPRQKNSSIVSVKQRSPCRAAARLTVTRPAAADSAESTASETRCDVVVLWNMLPLIILNFILHFCSHRYPRSSDKK